MFHLTRNRKKKSGEENGKIYLLNENTPFAVYEAYRSSA